MARMNLEGASLFDNIINRGNRFRQVSQTLTGTLTMAATHPHLLFLDTGASARTVLLPPESRGNWYVILNQTTTANAITVKEDSNTTTIAILNPGQGSFFFCDGTTWQTLSDTGAGSGGNVIIADAASYTALASNSGRLHIIPDVTASITVTLPTPDEGLMFEFVYGGVAADAQNHIITGGAGNFLKGNISFLDQDAGAGADELSAVFGNGSSHITFTMTTPQNYRVAFSSDGALWYVSGYVLSNTACAFS